MEGTNDPAQSPEPDAGDAATESQQAAAAASDTTASGEPPIKVCPHCSVQSKTDGDYCPHCGASFVHGRKGLSKRTKVIVLSVIGVLLLAGAGAGIAQKISHDNQVAEDKQRAEAAAKAAAEQRRQEEAAAKAAADEQAAKDDIERSLRRVSIRSLRKSITKDARSRVSEGVLEGPIYGTQCDPVGGGSVGNLDASTSKFECLAINKKNGDGTVEGWRFSATMNWDEGSYTWRLGSD